MKQPSLYLPHGGGPCFFMEWTMGPPDTWNRMAEWLRGIPGSLPEPPTALLVVSAHWEAPVPTVTSSSETPLLYDYGGFPAHTYQLQWPAPGSPDLAARVQRLLASAGIAAAADARRGFDHGVFIPLKVAYPTPSIPTVQLSLRAGLDPLEHLAMGRALAPLRDEGVLIVGSGMSYHNMRGFMAPRTAEVSARFDDWLATTVAAEPSARDAALARWSSAPLARECHPREEHLLPLMVAAGAAGADVGERVFRDQVMGAVVSAVRFG
jgi:aromatic ring-opening dioxygenase catalytic subunit (LigB family)